MLLHGRLETFFTRVAPVNPGDRLVVAFSGGPDSTALLALLADWSRSSGVRLLAAHLDHAADPGSAERARAAGRLARRLGTPWVGGRRPIAADRRRGESAEEASRRVRYRFLEEIRRATGARWIATAHHADDQAETVLLRLARGSGLAGLAGIRERHGQVVRPLLTARRSELAREVADRGLRALDDPTNRSLEPLRNRFRLRILPCLEEVDPALSDRLPRLAAAAAGARDRLDATLAAALAPRWRPGEVVLDRARFAALPPSLRGPALGLAHRLAGAPFAPTRAARAEIARQLATGGQIGCDCGGGWRWESLGGELLLYRRRAETPRFSYTFEVPGSARVGELGLEVRACRARRPSRPAVGPAGGGSRYQVELALPPEAGGTLEVRNRRPGDRLHPAGSRRPRSLKEILVEHRIPRWRRNRVPLLVAAGRILWVPGVATDRSCIRSGTGRDPFFDVEIRPTKGVGAESRDRFAG